MHFHTKSQGRLKLDLRHNVIMYFDAKSVLEEERRRLSHSTEAGEVCYCVGRKGDDGQGCKVGSYVLAVSGSSRSQLSDDVFQLEIKSIARRFRILIPSRT